MQRRHFLALTGALTLGASLPLPALAAATPPSAPEVLNLWYRLVLELVRHTATYSPPVAARAFAYLGVAAYEATAPGFGGTSLAGQLAGLDPLPTRTAGAHDEALVLHGLMSDAVQSFFGNTGPTGQRAMAAMRDKVLAKLTQGVDSDTAARSLAHGQSVAHHIEAWSRSDGGADVANMGFPMTWSVEKRPENWVPTSAIVQQQAPLLPNWGQNRRFGASSTLDCVIAAPPDYSEDPASAFYAQAKEVYDISKSLTDAQKAIARYWSDDAMLSQTPPGHWVSIALDIFQTQPADLPRMTDCLARLGMAVSDGFVACWQAKFQYNRLRPVTYIRRVIDPKWEPLLITPPFPEYPSGHAVQSGAAAAALTAVFGPDFAFTDTAHVDENMKPRPFPSFAAAAEEAALSRLLGGIHFRAANDNGLILGACVGQAITRLRTLA